MKKLRLRTAETTDIPFLHTLFNDQNVMDYWFTEPYYSLEKMEAMFKANEDSKRNFIAVNEAGDMVGLVGLYGIDLRHRHAEFAIAFDPSQQGKGYASLATSQLLDYAFLTLNLRKVYLIVLASNEKAIHIYQKFGFKMEGVFKDHYYINGNYENGMMMGLFKKDYLKHRDQEGRGM